MIPYIYPNLPNWLDPNEVKSYDKKTDWIAERKKNGWRCLAIMREDGLKLWTRRNTLIPDLLPLTREMLHNLPVGTMLDGELMEKRTKDIKDQYYCFDILYLEGQPLMSLAWKDRRKYLESLIDIGLDISSPISLGKSLLYDQAIGDGDEGIVMKNINSKYMVDLKSCPHNPYWIKAKKPENAFKTGGLNV
jgi:ATP-dependent DNA ligase